MPKSKSGLGRGFDALIPQNFDASVLLGEDEQIRKVAVRDVQPNPEQPRKHFDETALVELADSLKRHGVLQPLIVTPATNGYIIIAGERRWRAAEIAGLESVPVIVRTNKKLEQLEMALVENVQRVDLSPLEQAVSIQRLHEQFSLDYDAIAKRLGKASTTVQNIVRLLKLPTAARNALQAGTITEGHARSILALKTEAKQLDLLTLIQKNHWSVRQAETYVSAHKRGAKTTLAATKSLQVTTPETDKLGQFIKSSVRIRRLAKGGKLEIDFKNDTDLKRIVRLLLKR